MPESNPVTGLIDRPCPFITFYSFKGGVGRSMAVINVAGIMASRGFRVLVIDMDLEAPGLSFLANPVPIDADKHHLSQPGFVDLMLDAVERGADGDLFQISAADAVRSYCVPYELPEDFRRDPDGSLHIMPAGRIEDGYAQRLTRLDLPALYQEGFGLALIKAFKQVVQDSKLFDYVFVDSRTGFSDESGICTRDLADCLMVVSGLNKQNVEGTTRFLSALRRATDDRKPLEAILSPIPNGEDALVEEREKDAHAAFTAAWGTSVRTELHIPYHPQLALTEEPHIFRRRRGYLFEAYHKIEQNVLSLLGDTWTDVLKLAKAALMAKEYSLAEARLRRVNKLTDTREWAGLNLLLPSIEWVADRDAESVFHFIIASASVTSRENFGRWIHTEALLRSEANPTIAASLYERALEAAPDDADVLASYSAFLEQERRDFDAAEAMYKRILDTSPKHVQYLGKYALFLMNQRKDFDAAEAMFERALQAFPNDANNLGNYARLCLSVGRVIEGMDLVDKALLIRDSLGSPEAIDAELWMYVFCCGSPERHPAALQQLRALVEEHTITTGEWDFSGVITQAGVMGHPETTWLPLLADVLAGRRPPSVLDDWPAWREAAPQ